MFANIRTSWKSLLVRLEPYVKTDLSYLAKSSFWLNLSSFWGALISFILSILFARYVPKEIYGTYRYIVSIAGIASAFSLTGMNVAVMRAVAQGYDGIFKRSIIEQIKWSWPQFLFSFIAAIYYLSHGNVTFSICFFIVCILHPISTIGNTFVYYLFGKKDFNIATRYGMISRFITEA